MDDGSIDFRYMPTLANGHLGFQPYGDTVFLNGLYNGNDGKSNSPLPMLSIRTNADASLMPACYLYTFVYCIMDWQYRNMLLTRWVNYF